MNLQLTEIGTGKPGKVSKKEDTSEVVVHLPGVQRIRLDGPVDETGKDLLRRYCVRGAGQYKIASLLAHFVNNPERLPDLGAWLKSLPKESLQVSQSKDGNFQLIPVSASEHPTNIVVSQIENLLHQMSGSRVALTNRDVEKLLPLIQMLNDSLGDLFPRIPALWILYNLIRTKKTHLTKEIFQETNQLFTQLKAKTEGDGGA